jgi:hypothetical protein
LNNPPGKGNVGASYLNVAAGIIAVLEKLCGAGYNIGDRLPTAEELLARLELTRRNVESWEWGSMFGDPIIATAILDRLLHHSTTATSGARVIGSRNASRQD